MVVICPNCGREIFSDPDSCVMCGWKRGASSPRERGRQPGPRYDREYPPQRPPQARPPPQRPPPRYPRDRYEDRYREGPRREYDYPPPQRTGYQDRPRRQYPPQERRYPQRMQREDPRMQRGYQQRVAYPQRREPPYQRGRARERPDSGYGYEDRRRPPDQIRDPRYKEPGRNYCPNCQSEMYTDPDNCVLCGWSRAQQERRAPRYEDSRRGYPPRQRQDYQRDSQRRYPPEGWERRIDDKMGVRRPERRRGRESLIRPGPRPSGPGREGGKEQFKCENCGNPSLQFFADGLGRCPGCGHRFRYSRRPTTIRSKQKHKQFICSNCDCKNLQFFMDGTGMCPQCRREFRWSK